MTSDDRVMTDNKLQVDGNEYLFDELKDDQKYAVNQIKNLNGKIAQAEFDMNQLKAAVQHFHLALSMSLRRDKEEEKEEEREKKDA